MPALWLCLHLPRLPLDALGPWPEPLASQPALVWVADTHAARCVGTLNTAAQALGVVAGQRLGTAQALAPQALLLARQPEREAACLERLALALGSLTPSIEIAPPDQLLLEIQASLRLFGGVRALLGRARTIVQEAGVLAQVGLASTALGAQLLAAQTPVSPPGRGRLQRPRRRCLRLSSTRQALQPLPLALLARHLGGAADAALQDMLRALGTRSLADLHRLPRSGLTRRGGAAWVAALDRAEGRCPDPRSWFEPPETCRLTLDLPQRAESVAAVEVALAPLVQALCGWLALRWRAAQQVELRLRHEQGARRALDDERLRLDLASPTRDAPHLLTLLRERLQHLRLIAPVDALTLELAQSLPEAGQALALLPDAPDERAQAGAHAALIDRLRARLGPACVQRITLQADARPEKAERRLPPEASAPRARAGNAGPGSRHGPPPAAGPPRPSWLLAEPLPLPLAGELPMHEGLPLRLLTRAERIETGWHDGALVRRDYHVALGDAGRLWWVYRDRATPAATDDGAAPRWFLHGLFG